MNTQFYINSASPKSETTIPISFPFGGNGQGIAFATTLQSLKPTNTAEKQTPDDDGMRDDEETVSVDKIVAPDPVDPVANLAIPAVLQPVLNPPSQGIGDPKSPRDEMRLAADGSRSTAPPDQQTGHQFDGRLLRWSGADGQGDNGLRDAKSINKAAQMREHQNVSAPPQAALTPDDMTKGFPDQMRIISGSERGGQSGQMIAIPVNAPTDPAANLSQSANMAEFNSYGSSRGNARPVDKISGAPSIDAAKRTTSTVLQPQIATQVGTFATQRPAPETGPFNLLPLAMLSGDDPADAHLDGVALPDLQSAHQTGQTKHGAAPVSHDPQPRQVAHQLAVAISQSEDGATELHLNPQELGRVRLTMTLHDAVAQIVIHAERPETADMLRRNIDQLAQEFRALGYSTTSFSFGNGSNQRNAPPVPTANAHQEMIRDVGDGALETRHATSGLDLRL